MYDIYKILLTLSSATIRSYRPLLLVSLLDVSQCPHRIDERKVGQHSRVYVLKSIKERRLWVRRYFSEVHKMFYSLFLDGLQDGR